VLEDYLHAQFDRAEANPAKICSARWQKPPIVTAIDPEEMMGFGNLVFAGGTRHDHPQYLLDDRYLGQNPAALEYLREDPRRIVLAGEEFFRVFMRSRTLGGVSGGYRSPRCGESSGRISLAWASANFDETVSTHRKKSASIGNRIRTLVRVRAAPLPRRAARAPDRPQPTGGPDRARQADHRVARRSTSNTRRATTAKMATTH